MSSRLAWMVALLGASFAIPTSSPSARPAKSDSAVLTFVRSYLHADEIDKETGGKLSPEIGWTDLNGDGRPEALVYVDGRDWCGTGGCDLLVLERTRTSFRVRGETSITHLPIAVLDHRTNGWRDIVVTVAGGGILPGYRGVLPFDGHAYLANASDARTLKRRKGLREQVVMPISALERRPIQP